MNDIDSLIVYLQAHDIDSLLVSLLVCQLSLGVTKMVATIVFSYKLFFLIVDLYVASHIYRGLKLILNISFDFQFYPICLKMDRVSWMYGTLRWKLIFHVEIDKFIEVAEKKACNDSEF